MPKIAHVISYEKNNKNSLPRKVSTEYWAVLFADHHQEYSLEDVANTLPEDTRPAIQVIYDPHSLDHYLSPTQLLAIYQTILADDQPQLDQDEPFVALIEIFATPAVHLMFLDALVKMLIAELYDVGGDDTYFDYYPNTVYAVCQYAEALDSEASLKPLAEAIFNTPNSYSPDNHDDLVNAEYNENMFGNLKELLA